MNNVEKINYTKELQEKKEVLYYETERIEKAVSRLINEINACQNNCQHVAFRFGGSEYSQGFLKCLLCDRELNGFDYAVLINLGLIVDANVYRDENIIDTDNYKFDILCEILFDCFQNKFLELCEKNSDLDNKELVALLNQMILNDKQKKLIQLPNEPEQDDLNKSVLMRKKINKEIKGITHNTQGK